EVLEPAHPELLSDHAHARAPGDRQSLRSASEVVQRGSLAPVPAACPRGFRSTIMLRYVVFSAAASKALLSRPVRACINLSPTLSETSSVASAIRSRAFCFIR